MQINAVLAAFLIVVGQHARSARECSDMRDILVYADSFETWSPGVEYAAALAAARSGSLTAAFVYPTPDYMMPAYGAPALLAEIVEQARRIERESLAARERFVAWARARGVTRAHWQVAEGFLPETLAHLGNWHDLLVLERNGGVPWESPADLGALVVQSQLPCLIVPPKADPETPLQRIAVAWNGSPESVRAAHAAMPLLESARSVVLLSGRRRDPLSEIGWRPPFDMPAYLRRHGIEAEQHEIATTDSSAGEALLDAAAAQRANLLVMGAYGRSRFSEWIFGGATRHVLEHATLPVLMRH